MKKTSRSTSYFSFFSGVLVTTLYFWGNSKIGTVVIDPTAEARFQKELTITHEDSVNVTPELTSILQDVILLYESKPRPELFRRYHPDAIFKDAICEANGLKEVMAQFYGMPKVFPRSRIQRCHIISEKEIIESAECPLKHQGDIGRVLIQYQIDLHQFYQVSFFGFHIYLDSLVLLNLDPVSGQILLHEDRWYHKASWRTSFWPISGVWNYLRRANGRNLPSMMDMPSVDEL